jgi:hypothetical protein
VSRGALAPVERWLDAGLSHREVRLQVCAAQGGRAARQGLRSLCGSGRGFASRIAASNSSKASNHDGVAGAHVVVLERVVERVVQTAALASRCGAVDNAAILTGDPDPAIPGGDPDPEKPGDPGDPDPEKPNSSESLGTTSHPSKSPGTNRSLTPSSLLKDGPLNPPSEE